MKYFITVGLVCFFMGAASLHFSNTLTSSDVVLVWLCCLATYLLGFMHCKLLKILGRDK